MMKGIIRSIRPIKERGGERHTRRKELRKGDVASECRKIPWWYHGLA
jgi:hypothetical protein